MVRIIFLVLLALGFLYYLKKLMDQISHKKNLKKASEDIIQSAASVSKDKAQKTEKREPKLDDNEIGYFKIVKVNCKDGSEFEFISTKLPAQKKQVYEECFRLDNSGEENNDQYRYFVKNMREDEIKSYKNDNQ